jgi:prevent-host-death family protein
VATSSDRDYEAPRPRLDESGRRTCVAGGRVTHEIGVKELKNRASEVIDAVASGERVIVTRRTELAAVILSIDEALDFVLAHAEEFVQARHRARSEHRDA